MGVAAAEEGAAAATVAAAEAVRVVRRGSKRSGGGGGSKGSVWKACYSSKRQKTFYVNKLTDERSWHKPPDYDGD